MTQLDLTESISLIGSTGQPVAFLRGSGVLRRPLRGPLVRVGREAENDISPQGAGLSRFHAELRETESGWEVVDLGSKNGTFVGGARVDRADLPFRAELRFGGVALLFERAEAGAPSGAVEPIPGLVGRCPAMMNLTAMVRRLAPANAPAVILGESGVGKELIAQALHDLSGRSGAMINVNCGSMSKELVGGQLFGHVRGAFTGADSDRVGAFEAANGGTLFLDEIGEMPLALQAQLLRVLETGQVTRLGEVKERAVEVRVVCATHRKLVNEVEKGRFRADLYHRLMVIPLRVPPLRQRGDDIRRLAIALLDREAPGRFLSVEALALISSYSWPGNVRELHNVLRRATLLSDNQELGTGDLDLDGARLKQSFRLQPDLNLDEALIETGANLTQCAQLLGVSRSTLYRRLEERGWRGLERDELLERLKSGGA